MGATGYYYVLIVTTLTRFGPSLHLAGETLVGTGLDGGSMYGESSEGAGDTRDVSFHGLILSPSLLVSSRGLSPSPVPKLLIYFACVIH